MGEFIHLLDDAALEALRQLLGTSAGALLTSGLEMDQGRAIAAAFSLSLPNHRFVTIESDWSETPREGIDYHRIEVSIGDTPKNVTLGRDENGYRVIQRPHSVVRLHSEGAALSQFSVFTREEAGEQERVRYDAAIVFQYEDGRRFALSTNESIAGGLRYTDSIDDLVEIQSECPERLSVGRSVGSLAGGRS